MTPRNIRRSDAEGTQIVHTPEPICENQPAQLSLTKPGSVLPRTFYDRSPESVARDLLGKVLVHQIQGFQLAGRIIETEAYLGLDDPASHASVGRTARNAVLFGPPGFSYVYFIYGMHFCLNVSCLPDGEPGGVLFRALQPLHGLEMMRVLRQLPKNASAKQIAGGPGRLCEALAITRNNGNGLDLTASDSSLRIHDDGEPAPQVVTTPRIGIRKAADRPLRFLLAQENSAAKPVRAVRRRLKNA